jgi:hypothetical protein
MTKYCNAAYVHSAGHWRYLMIWRRKQMCDLAWVCKRREEDASLSLSQRAAFAEAWERTRRIASLPDAGGFKAVANAVETACCACRGADLQCCSGRVDWQQPCLLMREHFFEQT